MIFDSHTHFSADAQPGAGCKLLEHAAACGIGGALVSHVLAFPAEPSSSDVRQANQFVADECAAAPERLFFFAYLNPQQPDWPEELERCRQSGAVGVKLWISLKDQSGGLGNTIAVLKRAAALDLPVLLHTFDRTDGNLRGEIGIAEFCQMSQAVPECRMVAAHLGCNWRRALDLVPQASKNTFFDCCGIFPEKGMVREILKVIPADRLLYGSDWPCRSFPSQLFKIREAGLQKEVSELILWKNAIRLYRLPNPPSFPEVQLNPLQDKMKTDHFCFCGDFPNGLPSGGTSRELESLLEQYGIEAAMTVDASSILCNNLTDANRRFAAETVNLHRVRPLATINPRASDALQTISEAAGCCAGLWFSPYWHVWQLNDSAYYKIWEAAADSGLPVYINCGAGEYRARPAYPEVRPVPAMELCGFPKLLPAGIRCCIQGFPGRIPTDWPKEGAAFLWTAEHLSDYGSGEMGSMLAEQLAKENGPQLVCGSEYPFRALNATSSIWQEIQRNASYEDTTV